MNDSPPNDDPQSTEPGQRRVPMLDHLGIEHVMTAAGRAQFRVDVDDRHLRTLDLLHGGMTATMLDSALGMAARTVAPPDHHVVTVQLNLNFVRLARNGDRLIAAAEVRHAGGRTAVASGELRTEGDGSEGDLVALATGTFMFLPVP